MLSVINFVLSLLKLLAAYSNKAFALVDVAFTMCRGTRNGSAALDDVTLQVHECVAPPEQAAVEALCSKFAFDIKAESQNLNHVGFTDADCVALGHVLKDNAVLTTLR